MVAVELGSFANGTEEFHFLSDNRADGFEAWLEQFAWVITLSSISGSWVSFASGAVSDGGFSEGELALGVDVDLAHTAFDSSFDLIFRDTGSAMEDEWDATGGSLNLL